jgi:hypothetical protein
MQSSIITGGPVHNYKFKKLSSRGGSKTQYPWMQTPVNGWFFKAVSKEDLDKDKGRPGYPKSIKDLNMKWSTEKTFCEETKQYGYLCTRLR